MIVLCLGSEVPRDPRAPWIKYKVGQVFRHKENKYRGEINKMSFQCTIIMIVIEYSV